MADFACPVEDCTKSYKSEKKVADHVAKKHPDYEPLAVIDNAPGGDTGPVEKSDVEAELRKRIADLEAELAKPASKRVLRRAVKPITDKELGPLVTKAAKLLWDRNRKLEDAVRRKREGRHDEADKLTAEADALEVQAAPLCAKAAGVTVDDLAFKTKKNSAGQDVRYRYGLNVRRGILRVVLRDGRRMKVEVSNLARAKWDNVHDNEADPKRRANETPDAWKKRTTVPALR